MMTHLPNELEIKKKKNQIYCQKTKPLIFGNRYQLEIIYVIKHK